MSVCSFPCFPQQSHQTLLSDSPSYLQDVKDKTYWITLLILIPTCRYFEGLSLYLRTTFTLLLWTQHDSEKIYAFWIGRNVKSANVSPSSNFYIWDCWKLHCGLCLILLQVLKQSLNILYMIPLLIKKCLSWSVSWHIRDHSMYYMCVYDSNTTLINFGGFITDDYLGIVMCAPGLEI